MYARIQFISFILTTRTHYLFEFDYLYKGMGADNQEYKFECLTLQEAITAYIRLLE